ncbi:MAG: hypothetical protein IPP66_08555 [Anaerolineales bacterium]|nr:hypothetical protein [Anaerolineales bacterium]
MNIQELLDSIPTPAEEEMVARRQFAKRFTVIFLRKGPASRDDEERNERLQLEHLQHLTKLQVSGKLILNGPVLTDHDILGISIYDTELEDAIAMAEADPKVKAGYLTVEAIPWIAVPNNTKTG